MKNKPSGKSRRTLASKTTTSCIDFGTFPPGVYGSNMLPISGPNFYGQAATFNASKKAIPTKLEDSNLPGVLRRGLGRFIELQLTLKAWAGSIIQVKIEIVSSEASQTLFIVKNDQGLVIDNSLKPTPHLNLAIVNIAGANINQIILPSANERTLLTLCVETTLAT